MATFDAADEKRQPTGKIFDAADEKEQPTGEIFDVVDEEGMPTGETVPREIAHAEGIRHRTAHIWVVRRQPHDQISPDKGAADQDFERQPHDQIPSDKGAADQGLRGQPHYTILLQKRAMDKDSFPGRYDTSSAGHIHAGDEPRISAVREIGEELGIHVSPDDLSYAGKFSINFQQEFHGKPFLDNEVAFVYVYEKPVELKDLTLQKEEVEDAGWFDLEETLQAVQREDPRFCVPEGGLRLLLGYLKRTENDG